MSESTSHSQTPRPAAPQGANPVQRQAPLLEKVVLFIIGVMLIAVVTLAMWLTVLRIDRINDQNAFDQALRDAAATAAASPAPDAVSETLAQAQAALAEARLLTVRAEDAQNTVDLLLSFLEGATVLVGVAIGAAAYFGFRNYREIREDTREDREKVEQFQAELQKAQRDLDAAQTDLMKARGETESAQERMAATERKLDSALSEANAFRDKVNAVEQIFSWLVLAHQEMRLGNYQEVYQAAIKILELDPEQAQALYLAGWLENQFIPAEHEKALPHLQRAVELSPHWPSARAALGVAQRRRAIQATEPRKKTLLIEANHNLEQALNENPRLLDPNLESFFGPLGGLYRERGDFAAAQRAYEEACRVTPGSSYPAGNLAALYLRDCKVNGASLPRAVAQFEDTLTLAKAELAQAPSDYFILMDIAMSTIILGGADLERYPESEGNRYFEKALNTDPTSEMLSTSQRGLQNLWDYCPDEWGDVRTRLGEMLTRVSARIEQLGAPTAP